MTVRSALFKKLFKKKAYHLVTYESGPSKTLVDYFLVMRYEKEFLKDMKVLTSEGFITQHKPLACDFMIRRERERDRERDLPLPW